MLVIKDCIVEVKLLSMHMVCGFCRLKSILYRQAIDPKFGNGINCQLSCLKKRLNKLIK